MQVYLCQYAHLEVSYTLILIVCVNRKLQEETEGEQSQEQNKQCYITAKLNRDAVGFY